MSEWKNFEINKNQIDYETDRAVLVKMPNNSDYAGFKFWHPKRCVHDGSHSAALSIGYTDSFVFKLERKSNKTFKTLDSAELSADELVAQFATTSENITAPSVFERTTVDVNEAPTVEVGEVNVIEDLTND